MSMFTDGPALPLPPSMGKSIKQEMKSLNMIAWIKSLFETRPCSRNSLCPNMREIKRERTMEERHFHCAICGMGASRYVD